MIYQNSCMMLKLGLDTYTVRGFRWNAFQLLDYAEKMRLDTIQLGSSNFESLDPDYVRKVKTRADQLKISIDAAIGCICATSSFWKKEEGDPTKYLLKGLQLAKGLGSTNLHVFLGGFPERQGFERHVEETSRAMKSVRSQALDAQVKIAVENHGDFQARELKALVEETGRDFVGVCLDSGNAVTVLEDPVFTLEVLGPYVITTHIRDSIVYDHPRGAAYQWVALGDGTVDLKTFFAKYRELCPQAGVQLEILTGSPPRVLPYLEPDFWKAFAKTAAPDFARFVALTKKGHPFEGTMLTAPRTDRSPEYEAALKEQQRVDLERSFDYASRVLGIGERRRGA